ncbi:MAG TPA: ribbon-helix-helix domain-containing protein [Chloroflexota bacterium]|nr:ribbon-helix-helix domain-containing protein [Chloroflexota bacterium]
MKVSVSLPDDYVQFLDSYAQEQGCGSRSAVVQKAVQLLRATELAPAYEDAWQEWAATGEDDVWDVAAADGLS